MKKDPLDGHPERLSNEDIQALGEKILKNGSSMWNFWRTPVNALAQSLKEYNQNNSPQEKWVFLIHIYQNLPSNDTMLTDIQLLFKKAFHMADYQLKYTAKLHKETRTFLLEKEVNDYFKHHKMLGKNKDEEKKFALYKCNQLTNDIIQKIGRSYLKKHGQTSYWPFTIFHSNHAIAKQLKTCNLGDCKSRWLFLAEIYSTLPNNRGEIAKVIRGCFEEAFNFNESEFGHLYFSSTQSVAQKLTKIVNNKYTYLQIKFPTIDTNSMLTSGLSYAASKAVDSLIKRL